MEEAVPGRPPSPTWKMRLPAEEAHMPFTKGKSTFAAWLWHQHTGLESSATVPGSGTQISATCIDLTRSASDGIVPPSWWAMLVFLPSSCRREKRHCQSRASLVQTRRPRSRAQLYASFPCSGNQASFSLARSSTCSGPAPLLNVGECGFALEKLMGRCVHLKAPGGRVSSFF